MANVIIRTRDPKTEGGNLDDVQISFVVEALDEAGNILAANNLWLSAKGVRNDPEEAARVSQEAAEQWALDNAAAITDGIAKAEVKAPERAAVQPILDAIAATPEQVKDRAEIEAVADVALDEAIGEVAVKP